jgi:hypothetical protein
MMFNLSLESYSGYIRSGSMIFVVERSGKQQLFFRIVLPPIICNRFTDALGGELADWSEAKSPEFNWSFSDIIYSMAVIKAGSATLKATSETLNTTLEALKANPETVEATLEMLNAGSEVFKAIPEMLKATSEAFNANREG